MCAARNRADAIGRSRRIEAGADDHREMPFVPAIRIRQRVEVADVDVDLLAGLDVGDRLRKNVRTLLRQQRGDVALRLASW